MTPEEQNLIARVFDRMREIPPAAIDIDAERLIRQNMERLPDASYGLVQSILVQEQTLQRMAARLRQLEDLVAVGQPLNGPADGRGSFLSAYRVQPPPLPGSVPAITPATAPPAGPLIDDRPRQAEPSRAGGFLASALTTASGVAGGMLLTDGLRELFGGHAASGTLDRAASPGDLATLDRLQDQAQDDRLDADEARRQLADDDAALDEAQDSLESSGGDAGWDSGDA